MLTEGSTDTNHEDIWKNLMLPLGTNQTSVSSRKESNSSEIEYF